MINTDIKKQQKKAATIAQSLYLANLLVFPIIAFIALLLMFYQRKNSKELVYQHQVRAIQLSIAAGVLLLLIPALVVFYLGNVPQFLMLLLLYFIVLHVCFVLVGMINVSRAMSNKPPCF